MTTAEQMLNTAKGPHMAMADTIQARLDAERISERQLWDELLRAEEVMRPYEERMKAARSAWCESRKRIDGLELLLRFNGEAL